MRLTDSQLVALITDLGHISRDETGRTLDVVCDVETTRLSLQKLGKLLRREDRAIRSRSDFDRVQVRRDVFERLGRWRVVSAILVPLLLHHHDHAELMTDLIYLLISLLLPPSSHAADHRTNYLLLVESRDSLSRLEVLRVFVAIAAPIVKKRCVGGISRAECQLLTGILEVFISLLRLQDAGKEVRASGGVDRLVGAMADAQVFSFFVILAKQNSARLQQIEASLDARVNRTKMILSEEQSSEMRELQQKLDGVEATLKPSPNPSSNARRPSPQPLCRTNTETQLEILPPDTQDLEEMRRAAVAGADLFPPETQTLEATQLDPPERETQKRERESSDEEANDAGGCDEASSKLSRQGPIDGITQRVREKKSILEAKEKRRRARARLEEALGDAMSSDSDIAEKALMLSESESEAESEGSEDPEDEEDIKLWNNKILEVLTWLLRNENMTRVAEAAVKPSNGGMLRNDELASRALRDSIAAEKRQLKTSRSLQPVFGTQGFYMRGSTGAPKICRTETLATSGGIVESRPRVRKARLQVHDDVPHISVHAQRCLGRFLEDFLERAADDFISMHLPTVTQPIIADIDAVQETAEARKMLAVRFFLFSRAALQFCRARAALVEEDLDLHAVARLLRPEVFTRAFDLALEYHQRAMGKVANAMPAHQICVGFLKEAFATIAAMLQAHRPPPSPEPGYVDSPVYTATRALAAQVLFDMERIDLTVRYLREQETFRNSHSYREDLVQLVHVIILCLEEISRDGVVYLQRKVRRRKAVDVTADEAVSEDDDGANASVGIVDEDASTVYSSWTDSEDDDDIRRKIRNRKARRDARHMARELHREQMVLGTHTGLRMLIESAEGPRVGLRALMQSKCLELEPHKGKDRESQTHNSDDEDDEDDEEDEKEEDEASNKFADDAATDSEEEVHQDLPIRFEQIMQHFMLPKVFQTYIDLLQEWRSNQPATNSCVCSFLRRMAFKYRIAPCLHSLEALVVYEDILAEADPRDPATAELHGTARKLVRRWIELCQQNPLVPLFSLGWPARHTAEALEANQTGLVSIYPTRSTRQYDGDGGLPGEDFAEGQEGGDQLVMEVDPDEEEADLRVQMDEDTLEKRMAAVRARRWTAEDDELLRSTWTDFALQHGHGFCKLLRTKVFSHKVVTPKFLLEKATSLGLAVPEGLRAFPDPKAKWTDDKDRTLEAQFPHYAEKGDMAELRENFFPEFTDEQILRRAKKLRVKGAADYTARSKAEKQRSRREARAAERERAELEAEAEEELRKQAELEERRMKKEKKAKKKEKKEKKEKKKEERRKRLLEMAGGGGDGDAEDDGGAQNSMTVKRRRKVEQSDGEDSSDKSGRESN